MPVRQRFRLASFGPTIFVWDEARQGWFNWAGQRGFDFDPAPRKFDPALDNHVIFAA
jgi:hypothetical protein